MKRFNGTSILPGKKGSSLWLGYPYSWGEKEAKITVTAAARARLEAIIAAPSMKQKYVWRARIVLLSAAGVGTMAIVRQVGKSKRAVWRWRERFVAEGVGSSPKAWVRRRRRGWLAARPATFGAASDGRAGP